MKEFQDLIISINKDSFDSFSEYISKVSNLWKRDNEKEDGVTRFTDEKMYCYNFLSDDEEVASLWLSEKDTNNLYVSNIVPIKSSQLTIDEYNKILKLFCEQVLSQAQKKFNFKLDISKDNIELEDLLTDNSAKALRAFSALANKSTGRSHPMDQKRWFDFISLTFYSDAKITPELLEKYLIEDGWDQNAALELACDYEYSIDLLSAVR
ncbi:hypothetical protein [Pseudoalteromonas prydzensis]|uniref:hypothetical protein n=1 Tax=Pseudoalteromonas prydzensis TaxID=182141 RepID=UPI0007E51C9F|nr:hypothetical protein [Pseudoalteromonas prydzensis]MBE0377696.1 hypothetical protein [Pseudoalteromonas prydzensis ACAM 620]